MTSNEVERAFLRARIDSLTGRSDSVERLPLSIRRLSGVDRAVNAYLEVT